MFADVLRYQPPIPAEEVKPAFDYDHEGANLIVFIFCYCLTHHFTNILFFVIQNPIPLVEEEVVVEEEAGEVVSSFSCLL
jgi:hypothetical protein